MADPTKPCSKCRVSKPLGQFHVNTEGLFGRRSFCKKCSNTVYKERRAKSRSVAEKSREQNRQWKEGNPDKVWAARIKRNFGLSVSDYKIMLDRQKGVCAICLEAETAIISGKLLRLSVDHCHTTGKIRGLLCRKCNLGLGHLKDNVLHLKRAIDYLKDNE